ncbi:phage tail fiber [Escherichia coli]|nr:phage tail fiber [Escherichia coli]
MHRIDTLTAVKDKFGPGKNGFTDGNIRTGRLATWLNSAMWDAIQEEMCAVIERAGIELNKEEHDQLYKAILLLAGGVINEVALLAKNNLSDVEDKDKAVENLGLKPTVDKAKNAVQRDGDTMTGELKIRGVNALRIFNEAFGLIFRRSEECLHLIPTSEGQGENGDIGPLRPFAINLRTGAISVSHGAKIDGGLALGTDNALGGNSITLGDNDTGIKQGGDGVLLFYSNGQLAFGLQPASADFYKRVAYIHQGITPDGSGAFADQLNNATAPFVQTRFAWNPAPGGHYVPIVKGLSVRNGQGYPGAVSFGYLLTEQQGFPVPCIHMRGDNGNEALWQFNPNDKSFFSPGPVIAGGATLASNGDINGAAWGGWLSAYLRNNTGVQDVRYGSEMFYNPGGNQVSWTFRSPSGHGLSGINVQETGSNSADNIGGVYYRPLQKLINGTWYNVASV